MGWLTRLLGGYDGWVRFKGVTDSGRKFDGKVHVSCIGYTREELTEKLRRRLQVEQGINIISLEITHTE